AVLDVDPVLRRRDEPAALSRPLVDAVAEQVGRVRDVALRLQSLLGARAGEVLDPVGRERLVRARDRHGEVGAAEEARHRLALEVAGHHELPRRGRVLLPDAAGEPARAYHGADEALRVHRVRVRVRLVGRLAGPGGRVEEVLVRGQAGDRLTGGEQTLPGTAHLGGDAA